MKRLIIFFALIPISNDLFSQKSIDSLKHKIQWGISISIYHPISKLAVFWAPGVRIGFNEYYVASIGNLFVLSDPRLPPIGPNIDIKEARPKYAPIGTYQFFPFGRKRKLFFHFEYLAGIRYYKNNNIDRGNLPPVSETVWMTSNIIGYGFNISIAKFKYPFYSQIFLSVGQGVGYYTFSQKFSDGEKYMESNFGRSDLRVEIVYDF